MYNNSEEWYIVNMCLVVVYLNRFVIKTIYRVFLNNSYVYFLQTLSNLLKLDKYYRKQK